MSDALNKAWQQTVTPYSQIKDLAPFDQAGQYDWLVKSLTPMEAPNGLYAIKGEFQATAPAGYGTFVRTLYVGTHKDKFAELPETRLQNSSLRFLRNIAKVNGISTNDQSDAALCAAITNRTFGCALVDGKPYTDKNGKERTGLEFGRNVTPAGQMPARIFTQSAGATAVPTPPVANGHDASGATFGAE